MIKLFSETWILPSAVLFAMVVYSASALVFYNSDGWFQSVCVHDMIMGKRQMRISIILSTWLIGGEGYGGECHPPWPDWINLQPCWLIVNSLKRILKNAFLLHCSSWHLLLIHDLPFSFGPVSNEIFHPHPPNQSGWPNKGNFPKTLITFNISPNTNDIKKMVLFPIARHSFISCGEFMLTQAQQSNSVSLFLFHRIGHG